MRPCISGFAGSSLCALRELLDKQTSQVTVTRALKTPPVTTFRATLKQAMSRARQIINDRMSIYGFGPQETVHMRPLRKQIPTDQPFAKVDNESNCVMHVSPLHTDKHGNILNADNQYVQLKGINADALMKLPKTPHMALYEGDLSDAEHVFFEGDHVTFVGRPWPLEDAHEHLMRIKRWGYNTIRYLLTWEAIEHAGPGKYDEAFIDYTIATLKIIHEIGGLHVILELHQDVWSRYTGGLGAPMWTIYAAGLDPRKFSVTEAAVLHNHPKYHRAEDPEEYYKMIWTTNYHRLACLVMFTLFFAGKTYFPDLKINGVNIQDYLQDHYYGALRHVWKAVNERVPELITSGMIIGVELMNEPNAGLIGYPNLGEIPAHQNLRVGTTPTMFQAVKTAMGFACEVDLYKISITGPAKKGSVLVDPKGVRAWMLPDDAEIIDTHYGWKRLENWKMGECIFEQQQIWRWHADLDVTKLADMTPQERLRVSNEQTILLKPHYFSKRFPDHVYPEGVEVPKEIDCEFFLDHHFVDFFQRHKQVVREVCPLAFVLMQFPVLEMPPLLVNDRRRIVDDKFIATPHYYDGLSLMFKTWNLKYNVDTLGIMRGRYANPVLGIVFGERAIRNCLRRQFKEIKQECNIRLGKVPVLMLETGMPFDMDDKKAYLNYRYHSQTAALDAISQALEGCQMHHTYWVYCSINCHKWGDRWNNEDFLFWSPEDHDLPIHHTNNDLLNPSSVSSSQRSLRRNSAGLRNKVSGRKSLVALLILERNSRTRSRRASAGTNGKPTSPLQNLTTPGDVNGFKDYKFSQNAIAFSRDEEEIEPTDLADIKLLTLNTGENGSEGNGWTEAVATAAAAPSEEEVCTMIPTTRENVGKKHLSRDYPSADGVRAVNAVVRPFVVQSPGIPITTEFDMNEVKYLLTVKLNFSDPKLASHPTIIFLPRWHFPFVNSGDIHILGGHVKYHERLEYLEWYHEREDVDSDGVDEASIMIRNKLGPITEVRYDHKKGYCHIT